MILNLKYVDIFVLGIKIDTIFGKNVDFLSHKLWLKFDEMRYRMRVCLCHTIVLPSSSVFALLAKPNQLIEINKSHLFNFYKFVLCSLKLCFVSESNFNNYKNRYKYDIDRV